MIPTSQSRLRPAMLTFLIVAMLTVAALARSGAFQAGSAAAQIGPATPPARIFGSVTVAGRPAAGATVAALVQSTNCGTATVAADGAYQIDVQSAASQAGCGTDGALVTFTIDGRRARESVRYQSGAFIQLDLSADRLAATVFVERWVRNRDEPCAAPFTIGEFRTYPPPHTEAPVPGAAERWCLRTERLPDAIEPFASYRMLAFLYDGRVEQTTGWITVIPNTPTDHPVPIRHERGVGGVAWERWTPLDAARCRGRIDGFWCIESVAVAPPVTGTVWYRFSVRHPDGRGDSPTGFIPASP